MGTSYSRLYFELIFVGLTVVMGMSLATSFLPILAHDLDPSGVLVGLVVAAYFLSRVFIELPAGIISDRVGRRKLLIAGIGLSALGALLCAQANAIYILILGRAIWGLGTALYFMNNTALLIDIFEPKVRGRALGMFNGIEFIGSFVGAPIGALLAGAVGYTNVFYFALALALSSFATALTSRGLRAVGDKQGEAATLSVGRTLRSLRNPGIVLVCMCSFSRMFVMQGIFSTAFQLYLNQELLLPVVHIGLIMGIRTGGHIIATVGSGFLSDKFGRRPVVMAGFLIEAWCLGALTSVYGLEMLLVVGFLEGFGEGLVFTSLIVLLSDIADPSVRGGAIGLYRTFMDVGGFTGPMAFMLIYTGFSPRTPFFVALGINLMNVVLLASTRTKASASGNDGIREP